MKSTAPEISRQSGLKIVTGMMNHRGEVGLNFHEKFGDFVKPSFHRIKAGPQGAIIRRRAVAGLFRMAFQHPVKVLRIPAQSDGQGFESAATTAALHGMPLDLSHDGHRDMRTLRKLALTPAKLADAIADNPRDRSPVLWIAFRHAFLRAPLPAPRVADPSLIETKRDQTTSIRNNYQAEISLKTMISAPRQEDWSLPRSPAKEQ